MPLPNAGSFQRIQTLKAFVQVLPVSSQPPRGTARGGRVLRNLYNGRKAFVAVLSFLLYYSRALSSDMQAYMLLAYEPASEPLCVFVKSLVTAGDAGPLSPSLLLTSLELSDTETYEPSIRALFGTASHDAGSPACSATAGQTTRVSSPSSAPSHRCLTTTFLSQQRFHFCFETCHSNSTEVSLLR